MLLNVRGIPGNGSGCLIDYGASRIAREGENVIPWWGGKPSSRSQQVTSRIAIKCDQLVIKINNQSIACRQAAVEIQVVVCGLISKNRVINRADQRNRWVSSSPAQVSDRGCDCGGRRGINQVINAVISAASCGQISKGSRLKVVVVIVRVGGCDCGGRRGIKQVLFAVICGACCW